MVSTPKHLAQVIVNQLNFLPPSYWGDPTPLSMDIIYIHLYTSFHHNILGCSHPSQFVSFSQYFWGAPTPLISDSFDLLCSNYLVHVGLNLIIVSIPVQTIGSPSPISPNWSQKNDQSGYRPMTDIK